MTNFIPIFPLNIIVYPGEKLHLHIFEERYKELINQCYTEHKPFGIPPVINQKISEVGTLVEVTGIARVYEDGKMDIVTKGLSIFRVLEVIKSVPEKLYSGAIVNYPHNDDKKHLIMMRHVLASIRELHRLLKVTRDFKKPDEELTSYDVAHHAGLSIDEEYELLGLLREDQRLEYIKRHLKKVIPVIAGAENLKEKIQFNGHFRELKGFDLDF